MGLRSAVQRGRRRERAITAPPIDAARRSGGSASRRRQLPGARGAEPASSRSRADRKRDRGRPDPRARHRGRRRAALTRNGRRTPPPLTGARCAKDFVAAARPSPSRRLFWGFQGSCSTKDSRGEKSLEDIKDGAKDRVVAEDATKCWVLLLCTDCLGTP